MIEEVGAWRLRERDDCDRASAGRVIAVEENVMAGIRDSRRVVDRCLLKRGNRGGAAAGLLGKHAQNGTGLDAKRGQEEVVRL